MRAGDLIATARDAAGMTQAQLAEQVGVAPSTLNRWENQAKPPAIKPLQFRKLSSALRSLDPIALLNAMGYEVAASGAQRLPTQLVRDLLSLSPEVLESTAFLVHQLATRDPQPRERSR